MEKLLKQIQAEEEQNENQKPMFILKRFMNSEEMQSYFGISHNTLKEWMAMGLPFYDVSPRKRYFIDTDIEEGVSIANASIAIHGHWRHRPSSRMGRI